MPNGAVATYLFCSLVWNLPIPGIRSLYNISVVISMCVRDEISRRVNIKKQDHKMYVPSLTCTASSPSPPLYPNILALA